MMRRVCVVVLMGIVMLSACKNQEEEAKEIGSKAAKSMVLDPIRNAHSAVKKVENAGPVLLDTASNTFHRTSCRFADVATMETTTAASALERGARPDAGCLPAH